jgi:hypothetical protein
MGYHDAPGYCARAGFSSGRILQADDPAGAGLILTSIGDASKIDLMKTAKVDAGEPEADYLCLFLSSPFSSLILNQDLSEINNNVPS